MTGTGGPDVLVVRDVPVPRPGPGEILIRVEAVPVLYPEVALRAGVFPMAAQPPVVFGFQAAGVVTEIGPDVFEEYLGRRVVVATDGTGSYAEYVNVPAESATAIPDGLSTDEAAATLMSGAVALTLLETARFTGTETVLIEAGATGVGSYLVQLAKEAGAARVIATAGGATKLERARELGADEVIDHSDPDWIRQTRLLLDPATIDVVFDSIGGTSAHALLDLMTPDSGRMLTYGWLSGAPAQVTAGDLLARGLTLTACAGPAWSARMHRANSAALARAATLVPAVETVLPLDQAAHAHELVEARAPLGKIILRPGER